MTNYQIRTVFKILTIILLCGIVTENLCSENRTALIIANENYQYFGKLPSTLTEAYDLGEALKKLGFDTTIVSNAGREVMLEALEKFEMKLQSRKGLALFHYGGHAVQVAGKNYLIPVDAQIPDELRVPTRTINIEEVITALAASGSDTNIIILDACRNNPFYNTSERSTTRGLAVINVRLKNSIIVFSAEAGSVARDGVFTPILTKYIVSNGISFSEVLQNVRREVYETTEGLQIPGEYNQLFNNIYLGGISPKTFSSEKDEYILRLCNNQILIRKGPNPILSKGEGALFIFDMNLPPGEKYRVWIRPVDYIGEANSSYSDGCLPLSNDSLNNNRGSSYRPVSLGPNYSFIRYETGKVTKWKVTVAIVGLKEENIPYIEDFFYYTVIWR